MESKFIADVHLGKLARLLRLLGFDTLYKNDFTKNDLIRMGHEQDRIVLSRDNSLSNASEPASFIVTNEDPWVQLKQVIEHFHLQDHLHPFSRCTLCNGLLDTVTKKSIAHLLENSTAEYFDDFWKCVNCSRVYWKGSHYEKMVQQLEKIISK